MKKIISILLSVLMLAGCFVAMIPAVGAKNETIENGNIVPTVEKGEQIYAENFEGANLFDAEGTAYRNANLITALGWSGSLAATETTSDSVTLAGDANDHAVEIKAHQSTYLALTFVDDARLAGGDVIVEYTYKLTDNTGGVSQRFGVKTGGDASTNLCKDTVVTAMVQEQGTTELEAGFPGSKSAKQTNEFFDFATEAVEYVNSAGKTIKRAAGTGSTYGQEFRFRFVVDNEFGLSMWTIGEDNSATLIAYANMAEKLGAALNWKKLCGAITSDLAFSCQKALTVEVDDIAVYAIQRDTPKDPGFEPLAPTLILSEFMTSASEGTADVVAKNPDGSYVMDTDGNYKYAQDGVEENFRHEWIEIFNAGVTAVNVYDYAIAREAGILATNLYSGTVSEDEICYIKPGANTVTGNGQTRSYTNPAYEAGVLQPGEAAILFIPNNWFYATSPTYSSVNTFKEIDLKGVYGMYDADIAELKIFTICSEYNFGNNNSGNDLFAISPVEDGVAKVLGHNITDHECIVSLSADFKGGADMYNVFDGYGCNGYTVAQHKSSEVVFLDENSNYIGHGVVDAAYSPDGKDVDDVPCTPGYLPVEHRCVIEIPELVGYQVTQSAGGKYDLRIVAAVDRLNSAAFGMKIEFEYFNGQKTVTGFKEYYCRYYYKSISTDYGTGTFNAEDCDKQYLLVFHIEDCPANVDVAYKVTTFAIHEMDSGLRSTMWSAGSMAFSLPA